MQGTFMIMMLKKVIYLRQYAVVGAGLWGGLYTFGCVLPTVGVLLGLQAVVLYFLMIVLFFVALRAVGAENGFRNLEKNRKDIGFLLDDGSPDSESTRPLFVLLSIGA